MQSPHVPTAVTPVPLRAQYLQQVTTPARPDGSRIRLGLYGPLHRPTGTCYWIGLAEENPDGTTRRAWSRQYSRKNLRRAQPDYYALLADLESDLLDLPEPAHITAS